MNDHPFENRGIPESLFCWGVWGLLTVFGLAYIWRFGSVVPRSDDWYLVGQLAGGQPLNWSWLWEPVGDHRLPLQKLVVWLFWRLFDGNIKLALLGGFVPLALAAAILLYAAWRMRGKSEYFDAFFPMYLLHIGHGEIFLWWTTIGVPWNVALSSLLISAFMLPSWHNSWWKILVIQWGITLLVLNGSTGFLLSLPLTLAGLLVTTDVLRETPKRFMLLLLPLWLVVLSLQLLYAIGLHSVHFQQRTMPRIVQVLVVAVQVLAMSLGPVLPRRLWPISGFLVLGLLSVSAYLLLRHSGWNLRTKLVVACCFLATIPLAVGIGVGRAQQGGLLDRYALYAGPLLVSLYLLWLKMNRIVWCRFAQFGLFWLSCSMLGFNISYGLAAGRKVAEDEQLLYREIAKGASFLELSATRSLDWVRSQDLFHTVAQKLAKARVKPFDRIKEDPQLEVVMLEPTPAWYEGCQPDGRAWKVSGPEATLRFVLPRLYHVYCVKIKFVLKSGRSHVNMKIAWPSHTIGAFEKAVRRQQLSFHFNPAKPREAETVTFWVGDSLAEFDFHPSDVPAQLDIDAVEVLVRPDRDENPLVRKVGRR